MILIAFFLLLFASCWLYYGLLFLAPFFIPEFGAVPLANPVLSILYVGVFFYCIYLLLKFFRNKEEGILSIKGFVTLMFFVSLILWLPGDLIEGNPVEIWFSIIVLILSLILWFLSNRFIRQLPDIAQEAETDE